MTKLVYLFIRSVIRKNTIFTLATVGVGGSYKGCLVLLSLATSQLHLNSPFPIFAITTHVILDNAMRRPKRGR